MNPPASAPQPIGGVLDDAIKLCRACTPGCWLLALCSQSAAVLPLLTLQARLRHWTIADPLAALAVLRSGRFVLSAVIGLLAFQIFYYALIDSMNGVATGTPATLARSIGVGIRRLPRGCLTTILVGLIIGAGFILLIVPGIYWAGTLLLAFVVLVVEDAGILQSLRTSSRLVKWRWWQSMTIYSVALIIAAACYFMLGLSGGLLVVLLGPLHWSALDAQLALSVIGNTLLTVALTATLLAIYHDLKLRSTVGG